ncbi:hypothetical protein [Pseudovibrio sp. Tun.PSC04-5.I4]|uniref:hypothetical protein n=1 Tax=Pseudovibrio sp. Tun.PSC04-5.I4 TaxID=1798213 RepID=UPI0013564786|nr:hypothetical protein [Pseudovibrio sp. Tun.PSC04-5.I4]
MKQLVSVVALGLFLAGCANVEMPYEPEGSDEMRKSPCACLAIDYQPEGFEWINVQA